MRLIILRHAIAQDRELALLKGVNDSDRELTHEGIKRMKQGARGIKLLFPDLDVIAYSPYIRARQTAELLKKYYPDAKLMEVNILTPGYSSIDYFEWLNTLASTENICIVGHNPELSDFLNDSVNNSLSLLDLKKAGMACVVFNSRIEKAAGQLDLFLAPKYLRLLGERVKK